MVEQATRSGKYDMRHHTLEHTVLVHRRSTAIDGCTLHLGSTRCQKFLQHLCHLQCQLTARHHNDRQRRCLRRGGKLRKPGLQHVENGKQKGNCLSATGRGKQQHTVLTDNAACGFLLHGGKYKHRSETLSRKRNAEGSSWTSSRQRTSPSRNTGNAS